MANIKFSQFTNQAAADTTYLVGFDGAVNTNYTKAQVATWLTTGTNPIPTLYSADGTLAANRTVTLSTFNLKFDGTGGGRIMYSGIGEADGYALVSSATGVASWEALQEAGGGTGITTYTQGQILYSDASNSLATLDIGTVGKVLKVTGTAPNLIPGWADDIDTGLTSVTYTLGTGQTTPLSSTITGRALEITSNKYGGTNQVGYVPEGGTAVDFLRGDGTWVTPTNTTYSTFTGADGTNPGAEGLVPQPTATDNVKFLKGDGTWAVPTDTTDNAAGTVGQLQYTTGSGVFAATSDMVYTTDQLKVQNTLYLDGNGSGAGIVKLGCEVAGASHYVGLEGPTHSGANAYTIKFPDVTPTANQVLKVNTVVSSTANMIWAADTNTNTNIANADLTLDASRTLDLSADQDLTFTGSGTSKITFSNTGGVQIDEDTTFKKNAIVEGQGYTELATTAYSSTLALDFNDSNVQTIELTGNITLSAPLNVKLGATYILILKQGGSGGHSVTLHSSMKLPSNATFVPTAAAGKADVLTMIAYSSSVLMTVSTLNLATS